jgi:hypothetical protein
MRVLTIIELTRLTRMQLCDLLVRLTRELDDYREGSHEHQALLASLRNIRTVLARRDFKLG